jgi:hypothetical protein
MALAIEWVAKTTTAGLEMVLPGIAGHFLDQRLGTSYLALVGFGLGMVLGLWQLIRWTKPPKRPPTEPDNP